VLAVSVPPETARDFEALAEQCWWTGWMALRMGSCDRVGVFYAA
jgi:hypothetical protein